MTPCRTLTYFALFALPLAAVEILGIPYVPARPWQNRGKGNALLTLVRGDHKAGRDLVAISGLVTPQIFGKTVSGEDFFDRASARSAAESKRDVTSGRSGGLRRGRSSITSGSTHSSSRSRKHLARATTAALPNASRLLGAQRIRVDQVWKPDRH